MGARKEDNMNRGKEKGAKKESEEERKEDGSEMGVSEGRLNRKKK